MHLSHGGKAPLKSEPHGRGRRLCSLTAISAPHGILKKKNLFSRHVQGKHVMGHCHIVFVGKCPVHKLCAVRPGHKVQCICRMPLKDAKKAAGGQGIPSGGGRCIRGWGLKPLPLCQGFFDFGELLVQLAELKGKEGQQEHNEHGD